MKAALALLLNVAGFLLVWGATGAADPISDAGAAMVAPTLFFGVALIIAGAALVVIPNRKG